MDQCLDCGIDLFADEEWYCTTCLFQADLFLTTAREQSIWDIQPE